MSFCMRFFTPDNLIVSAIHKGNDETFYKQVKFRDVNKYYGIFTLLQICILYNRYEYIAYLLEEKKVNPNATYFDEEDKKNKTTMSLSVMKGDIHTVKLLILYGADLEITHVTPNRYPVVREALKIPEIYKKCKLLEGQLETASSVEDKIRINQELYELWNSQRDSSQRDPLHPEPPQPEPYNALYARKAQRYKDNAEKLLKEREESRKVSSESTPFLAGLK